MVSCVLVGHWDDGNMRQPGLDNQDSGVIARLVLVVDGVLPQGGSGYPGSLYITTEVRSTPQRQIWQGKYEVLRTLCTYLLPT